MFSTALFEPSLILKFHIFLGKKSIILPEQMVGKHRFLTA